MKNIFKIYILVQVLFFLIPDNAFSIVYDASSLYNSVSRAETVQDLYLNRWSENKERNFYFDLYGKLNTVADFEVNTYNAGSDEYNVTPLNLTRTYGSLTIAMPFGEFRKDPSESDLVIALDTAGYHYGLTRDVELKGNGAGVSGTATDYKFSQFFDDIYAVSILWRPYLVFHGGMIVSNEYIPRKDGTLKYSDPENSTIMNFYSFDIMGIVNARMNLKGNKSESIRTEINVNSLVGLFEDVSNIYYPVVTIGYENKNSYNDEPYDAVWVGDTSGKSDSSDFKQESARLNIFSIGAKQKIFTRFSIEGFCGVQYIDEDIYSKTDLKKIDPPLVKEWYAEFKYDPTIASYGFNSDIYFGISRYWDPSVSMQRDDMEKGDGIYGWVFGYEVNLTYIGGDIRVIYNYSADLKTLVESADKFAFEASLYVRI